MPVDGLLIGQGTVLAAHIDYNGHMNVVHYRAAFDAATDGLFAHLGLGPEALAAVEALEAAQGALPPPPDLGRVIAP
jgi:hypothetical protein